MEITGQLFVREGGKKAPDESARSLIAVVGILAVPVGAFKGEHLYTVVGNPELLVVIPGPQDISSTSRGKGLGHMVLEPIWRV